MNQYNYFSFLGENPPNLKLLGGKATNLYILYDNDIRIPPCFTLNSHVYREAISKLKISEMINTLFAKKSPQKEVIRFSNNIKTKFIDYKFPPEFITELKQVLLRFREKLGKKITFAVRSSANIEDKAQISFAGQAESFLFNDSLIEIVKSIKTCWASLFSPQNLLSFLKMEQHGNQILPIKSIDMSVIIQEMINSEIAGVLFTTNVLNNNENQMLINCNWGLCESITNNSVIPDLIILDKQDFKLIDFKIGDKNSKCIKNPNGPHTITIKNELEKKKVLCLQDNQLHEIYELGIRIEKIFNFPQDIEWAFQNDILYALQSRPITGLSSNK